MQTDAPAIEHELHPQSVQSRGEKEVLREVPGPPAKLLDLLHFLMFGSPRDLLNIYINVARQHGDVVRFRGAVADLSCQSSGLRQTRLAR